MIAKFKQWFFSKGITSRTLIAVTSIIVVTILLATVSLVATFRKSFSEQARINAQKDSQLIADKLDMFFESIQTDSIVLVTADWCQQFFRTFPDFKNVEENKTFMLYREMQNVTFQRLIQKERYRHVILYDVYGTASIFGNYATSNDHYQSHQREILSFIADSSVESLSYLHTSPWKKHQSNVYSQCISYLRKTYDADSGKMIGVIEFEIDQAQLSKLYQTVLENGSQVMIFSEDGDVQVSSVNMESNEQLSIFARLTVDGLKQKNCLFEKGNDLFSVSIANVFPLHVFNQIPSAIYWGSYSHYLIVAVLISIIALLLSLVLSRFLIHSITKPLSKIINGIMSIGENNLDTRIRVLDGGEIGLLVQQFNTMLDRTQHLMDSIIETEQKKRESELALIQMKMTPHFFYNALESICGLIVTDDKAQAIQVINLLATFYRGILSQGMEIITIEQELSISDSYIRIMQICYPNKFDYRVTCALKYRAIKINKLTLQPILENAIHHGFSTISTGGIISVTVFENSNSIYIDVIDNGCGFSRTTETDLFTNQKQLHTESYGLKNTNERIQMYFGNEYGLSFIPVTEGVTVRIRLPIKI